MIPPKKGNIILRYRNIYMDSLHPSLETGSCGLHSVFTTSNWIPSSMSEDARTVIFTHSVILFSILIIILIICIILIIIIIILIITIIILIIIIFLNLNIFIHLNSLYNFFGIKIAGYVVQTF